MTDDYTPTTEEIIRSFSIPTHRIVERREDETFSEYLSRASIEGHGNQMQSEAAACRWLSAHDAEVRASVLAEQGEWEYRISDGEVIHYTRSQSRVTRAVQRDLDVRRRISEVPRIPAGPWLPVEENTEALTDGSER